MQFHIPIVHYPMLPNSKGCKRLQEPCRLKMGSCLNPNQQIFLRYKLLENELSASVSLQRIALNATSPTTSGNANFVRGLFNYSDNISCDFEQINLTILACKDVIDREYSKHL
ncbi:MAG: hypothetical protein ACI9EW_001744 [Cellvibrionaceae bacterium]|jgi:hypothetical protein